MRPIVIKKSANLPLLLIFAGVIGGLIRFGVMGIFIGLVVLAVSYTVLISWVKGGVERNEADSSIVTPPVKLTRHELQTGENE
jgi:predicted PurR-regulated permease PerM